MQEPIVVDEIVRWMGGGCNSVLGLSGGRAFVIKCRENLQGPNVLANEVIATELMKAFGLPTAPWRLTKVSRRAKCGLDGVRGVCYVMKHSRCGLHFGSEFLGTLESRPYSFLPSSYVSRIRNRTDFVGALVFDVWAGSTDMRQAVYLEDRPARVFDAVFIDQGQLLGGPHWRFGARPGRPLCLDPLVYDGLLSPNFTEPWIDRLRKTVPQMLGPAIEAAPTEWYKGDVGALKSTLMKRLDDLDQLVRKELQVADRLVRPLWLAAEDGSHRIRLSRVSRQRVERQWCTPGDSQPRS